MRKIYYLLFVFSLSTLGLFADEVWTVKGNKYNVETEEHYTLAPNTTQTSLMFKPIGVGNQFKVVFTTTDLTDPRIRVKVVQSKNENNGGNLSVVGGERISNMFKRNPKCLVGINGDFQFERNRYNTKKGVVNTGDAERYNSVQGHSIADGEAFVMWGPKYQTANVKGDLYPSVRTNLRWKIPAIGFENGITPHIGYVDHNYTVEKAGKKIADITAINEGRRYAQDLILYTPAFNVYNWIGYKVNGSDATGTTATNEWGIELVLENPKRLGDKTTFTIKSIRTSVNKAPSVIGNGYVLSAHDKFKDFNNLKSLKIGDKIDISQEIYFDDVSVPNITQLISGYPQLLDNGTEVIDASLNFLRDNVGIPIFKWGGEAKRSRTAVGYNQDYSKFIMLVVEEKTTRSNKGITLYELADIMRQLGCYNAINLDGGGTTEMYDRIQGPLNIPSGEKTENEVSDYSSERTFHNCLTIESDNVNDKVITEIRFKDPSKTLNSGETYVEPVVMAYNQYGVLIETNLQGKAGFELNCLPELGTIDNKGGNKYDLTAGANASGTHSLVAYYTTEDGTELTTSMPVTVLNPEKTGCYLVKLEDNAVAEQTCGWRYDKFAAFGNKAYVFCKNNADKFVIQRYIYDNGLKYLGEFETELAYAMSTDKVGNIVIRVGSAKYYVYDENGTLKRTLWIDNSKNQVESNYITVMGDILNDGYIIVPDVGRLVRVYAQKLSEKNGVVHVGSNEIQVTDVNTNTYLNVVDQNSHLVLINTTKSLFKILNMDDGKIEDSGTKLGQPISTVLGGCKIVMGGKNVYLYNSGDGFTGTSSNKTGSSFKNEKYNFNKHLSGLTGVNYLLPSKINNDSYILFQYSVPSDNDDDGKSNTLRVYELKGNTCDAWVPMTGKVTTEVEYGIQNKKFKFLKDSIDTEYFVIKQLNTTLTLDKIQRPQNVTIIGGTEVTKIIGNGLDSKGVVDKNNKVTFTDLRPQDLQKGNIFVKSPASSPYTIISSVEYKWYDSESQFQSLTFNDIKPDYEVANITNLNGEVVFLKSHPFPGQPQNTVPNNAIVIIDFNMDPVTLKKSPVSEYRVYRKNKVSGKSELISTVRGDHSEGQTGGQGEYVNRKFMATYVEEVKDEVDARRLANDYVYYVETVYADVNSPMEGHGLNAQKIVRSEDLQLTVPEGGIPTEVEEIFVNNGVKVYPTLVDSYISISDAEGVNNVWVYSLTGTMVKNVEYDGESFVEMEMDDLEAGTYIVRINKKDFVKIVKR